MAPEAEEDAKKAPPKRELTPAEEEKLERRRAASAKILRFGDPVLKSKATPVSHFDEELDGEAERMIGLMHDMMGIGLAATQVGSMRRMLVFQVGPDSEPRALLNPEIEWTSDDLVTAEEGCLSLPKVTVDVERPMHARVSGVDVRGEALLIEATGLEARVLQHEIDHLDGILIVDRTERKQRRAALKALRAGEYFAPELLDPPAEEDATPEGDAAPEGHSTPGEPADADLERESA